MSAVLVKLHTTPTNRAGVFSWPLYSCCQAAKQQTMLHASGWCLKASCWPAYSAFQIGAKYDEIRRLRLRSRKVTFITVLMQ